MKKVMIVVTIVFIIVGMMIGNRIKNSEVTITETGYTEDGRIDMATVEGYRIFRQECDKVGIILPRRPQYE